MGWERIDACCPIIGRIPLNPGVEVAVRTAGQDVVMYQSHAVLGHTYLKVSVRICLFGSFEGP